MLPKNALDLLFDFDFGRGSLFKNQIDLVNELVSDHESSYYTDESDELAYARAVSRLKAYISQLLSSSARRSVTPELFESLRVLIKKKLFTTRYNTDEVTGLIVEDLKERNKKAFAPNLFIGSRRHNVAADLIKDIITAKYIAVFTAREISFEYEVFERKISFVNLLIENLIDTVKNNQPLKYYRFNFPLEQTCHLFWRGLRKEIVKHLKLNKNILPELLSNINPYLKNDNENLPAKKFHSFEEQITVKYLNYLSKTGTLNVFHLKAPIYVVPSVSINPNEMNRASTYIFVQTPHGSESIHKLTTEEQVHWKFFVWDNLKKNKIGTSIAFSEDY